MHLRARAESDILGFGPRNSEILLVCPVTWPDTVLPRQVVVKVIRGAHIDANNDEKMALYIKVSYLSEVRSRKLKQM